MMPMKLHHIGIACQDIAEFKGRLSKLFPIVEDGPIVKDPLQDATLCIVEMEGGLRMELIEGSPVQQAIKKNITYYHLCFTVKDIDKTVQSMQEQGCIIVSHSKPAVLFNDRKVAFLYTPIGLVELLEEAE